MTREKKFSLSPRAPLSLSRKAKNFFLLLPTLVRNKALFLYGYSRWSHRKQYYKYADKYQKTGHTVYRNYLILLKSIVY